MTSRTKILLVILAVVAVYYLGSNVDAIKKLIAGEEGLRLTVYQDTGGKWTIGYGHLVKAGERFFPYGTVRTITQAEADALFAADTAAAQAAVSSAVRVPLTNNQRAALVSLAFNIGGSAFANSALVRKLNAGDTAGAAAEFDKWIYDDHVVIPGLVNRRADEKAVFLA